MNCFVMYCIWGNKIMFKLKRYIFQEHYC